MGEIRIISIDNTNALVLKSTLKRQSTTIPMTSKENSKNKSPLFMSSQLQFHQQLSPFKTNISRALTIGSPFLRPIFI